MSRLRFLTVVATVAAACLPAPAGAQDPSVSLDVRMPQPWVGPSRPLEVEVLVRSDEDRPLDDLRVSVALYTRVRSRSSLQNAFAGRLPRSPLEAFTIRLPELPGRETGHISITRPLNDLGALEGAAEGVYPLEITVRRSAESSLASVVTAVALVSDQPPEPLRVLPVVSLLPRPLVEPDGRPDEDAAITVERLAETLSGLPADPSPALVVNPLLLDELAALSPALPQAAEVREAIGQVSQAARVLTVPHTPIALPHLGAITGTGDLRAQIRRGTSSLSSHLGVEVAPMLYPPRLLLDDPSLRDAAGLGLRGVLAPGFALASSSTTPTEAVRSRGITLIPVDAALSRAASRARAGLEVSRALVEVAMVFFERPARPRILAIELNWRASRAGDVLGSLVNAPWVEVLTADEALDVRASDRRLTLPRPPRPTRGFLRSLDGAREAVGRFTAFTLPGNPVTSSLHSSLEAALGTSWWSDDWDEGVRWTRQISGVVERERTQITAQGAGVTFTSRRGEIPITVVNRTGYPVRVRVDVTSPKLEFPEGSSRVIDVLPPPGATITFPANAEATGTFPLRITLSSPDGAVVVSSEELLVRSTAANVLALALTGGALLFLLVWYGRRLLPSGRPTDA